VYGDKALKRTHIYDIMKLKEENLWWTERFKTHRGESETRHLLPKSPLRWRVTSMFL
jgi:hypothetical protein